MPGSLSKMYLFFITIYTNNYNRVLIGEILNHQRLCMYLFYTE